MYIGLALINLRTMKRTHKAAQKKATGHARINNRISQSNANIGFDAIVFIMSNQALRGTEHSEGEFSLRKKKGDTTTTAVTYDMVV